jgi:hypothetical protein
MPSERIAGLLAMALDRITKSLLDDFVKSERVQAMSEREAF